MSTLFIDINKTVTFIRSRASVSKISDIVTITNFSIPPLPPEIPGIIPSDDPGEALSVSSKDIHLSNFQACKDIRDPLHPVTTMHKRHRQTDRQTDTDIVA